MKLDRDSFWIDFKAMASIGETKDGGSERLSMSDEDIAARKTLCDMLEKEGLETNIDCTGAIWARLEGEDSGLAPVIVASHIDTVRNGGKYDGLLGVMTGFQAMRQIKREKVSHKRPIELLVFPTEESARFNFPTVGSKLLAGKTEPQKLKEMIDSDGVSLYEALNERGFDLKDIQKARERLKNAFSLLELHIEQGPLLESEGIPVGVVSAIAAPTRLAVEIKGEFAHSGACPMHLRRDALAASAEFILAVERAGNEESKNKTVAAVTLCSLASPSMNVVPGHVKLVVDIRGIDFESIERCQKDVCGALEEICERRGVTGNVSVISAEKPVLLSKRVIKTIMNACESTGIRYAVMPSGAGHDAMNAAYVIEAGMIFVPCKGGVSHNPAEEVEKDDVDAGFAVLCKAILAEANEL